MLTLILNLVFFGCFCLNRKMHDESEERFLSGVDNVILKQYTNDILIRMRIYKMDRKNKKEAITALHKTRIIEAAEEIFISKGFEQTTIEDLSKASEYSRRTIYTYFESKEDILYHIIAKGLAQLEQAIEAALKEKTDFLERYQEICRAMKQYQLTSPHSFQNVIQAKTGELDKDKLPMSMQEIFELGTQINALLASFIQTGKEQGIIRQEVIPMQTVYILWSSMAALLTLVQTKGRFITTAFATSEDDFLDYGFKQIINSILEVRI